MDKAGKLKLIDKIIGTPLCYLLGVLSTVSRAFKTPADPADVKKILCIKTVAIGDLVVALPAFKALKEAFPSAHLALLTTPRVREVVEGSPFLDEIIYFDVLGAEKGLKGLAGLVRRIRAARFDMVVDFEHYYRFTTLIAYLSRAPMRVGFMLPGQGRGRLFTTKVPYPVDKHEVAAFLDLARAAGARVARPKLVEIAVSPEDQRYVDDWLAGKEADGTRIIGIHADTSPVAVARRWPPERFAELADQLAQEPGTTVIFTGDERALPLIDKIRGRMRQPSLSAAGQMTLKQFAVLAKKLDLFISLDTGPMHVAAAMGTPVIGLFGPNTPVKWGPYGAGHFSVYKELECSPCTKQYLGQVSKCQTGDCMKAITVAEVKSIVDKALPPLMAPGAKSQRI